MNVSFYKRKGKKAGEVYIYCRITVSGKRCVPFPTGLPTVKETHWRNGKVVGKFASLHNKRLTDIEYQIIDIYNTNLQQGNELSAEEVKQIYLNGTEESYKDDLLFIELIKMFVSFKIREIEHPITQGRYRHWLKVFENFLQKQGISEITAHNFKIKECDMLYEFLRQECELAVESANKAMRFVKAAYRYGTNKEVVSKSYIENYKLPSQKKKNIIYLTEEEMRKIETVKMPMDRLDSIRDLFVFQCYTGLSFADLNRFDANVHLIKEDGRDWIIMARKKTDTPFHIPLLPKPKEILDKHNGKLPLINNGAYNVYLKEIAVVCRIDKHLTTHVGRKTFATIMLNRGVSIEVVSRMLGHSSTKMTEQFYARVNKTRVLKEMKSFLDE